MCPLPCCIVSHLNSRLGIAEEGPSCSAQGQAPPADVPSCIACLTWLRAQVLYVAHAGDSGAVLACSSYGVDFPLRLTTDHKPNRPDEHARIRCALETLPIFEKAHYDNIIPKKKPLFRGWHAAHAHRLCCCMTTA